MTKTLKVYKGDDVVASEQGEGKVSVTLSYSRSGYNLSKRYLPSGKWKKMVKNLVKLMYLNSKPIQF